MRPETFTVLSLGIWTSLVLLFPGSLEVLFVLVLLGILVARELTDQYGSKAFKDRLGFFIYTFLFIFSIIVARRVYLILTGS